jgi:hypothetical protein
MKRTSKSKDGSAKQALWSNAGIETTEEEMEVRVFRAETTVFW